MDPPSRAPRSRRRAARLIDLHGKARDDGLADAEIVRLFRLPLFTGAKALRGRDLYVAGPVKIDDWRFWVPLICVFSGMRLNEACGLAVADIKSSDGINYFHVRDEVEGVRA